MNYHCAWCGNLLPDPENAHVVDGIAFCDEDCAGQYRAAWTPDDPDDDPIATFL